MRLPIIASVLHLLLFFHTLKAKAVVHALSVPVLTPSCCVTFFIIFSDNKMTRMKQLYSNFHFTLILVAAITQKRALMFFFFVFFYGWAIRNAENTCGSL